MNESTDNGVQPVQAEEIQSNAHLSNPEPSKEQDALQDAPETTTDKADKPDGDGSEKKARQRPGREERESYRLQQENAQLKAQLEKTNGANPQNPNTGDQEPNFDDFEDAIEWSKAQAKWEAKQALNGYKAEQEAKAQEQRFQENAVKHEEREAVFAQETPDYAEKVMPLYQAFEQGIIPQQVGKAVLESDISEKIVYHLANNPLHFQQVMQASSNPSLLHIYISEIEDLIEANPPQAAVKKTSAPQPISPVKGQSSTAPKNLDEMDYDDFVKEREKTLRR